MDVRVSEENPQYSREKAKALIMSGCVFVDGNRQDKAGFMVSEESAVEVRGSGLKYVSRGGLKLEKAIEVFDISLGGKVCADIGASTGGFTDCMLQNGADKVYAVDVGYGQLAWKLRTDDRVINIERQNARNLTKEHIDRKLDFASIDVSFISLELIIPVICEFLKDDGECVCLIKPQFEAGRGKVGKKGVVRDGEVHKEVVSKIFNFAKSLSLSVLGLDFSPVKGPEGNIEFLIYFTKSPNCDKITDEQVKIVCEKAGLLL